MGALLIQQVGVEELRAPSTVNFARSAPALISSCFDGRLNACAVQGQYEEAEKVFVSGIRYFPDEASLYTNAAIAASQQTDASAWQRGLVHGREALQRQPDDSRTHHVVGNLQQQLGRASLAEQHFARADKIASGLPPRRAGPPRPSFDAVLDAAGPAMEVHLLSHDPFVLVVDNFVKPAEVAWIRNNAAPKLSESFTYAAHDQSVRQSQTAWLGPHEHSTLTALENRLLALLGLRFVDVAHAELQVVQYEQGGYYRSHLDTSSWHPRDITALYYLTTVQTGGGTAFQNVSAEMGDLLDSTRKQPCFDSTHHAEASEPQDHGAIVPAVAGRAVIFYNTRKDGQMDTAAYHAGCQIIKGEKWIANHWLTLRHA
ncbi:uncharacterized protein MONBRDRAFT_4738 [Monosiga brevicollis MX1]|uniref:Fe2OG dioxygenase domain-containing protein n=1 Tax=Monosiga brevicollis TaxID=81824 RepID=A9UNT0_MONBE|nr:uncharacterized protein MONBRDRAFT_4738 [Monosiga brevicollis MX1]EDQ92299.1 predicted protein [Monosiga brevicollis MX1]|eukprot:XP_001742061.1 hypothetical protein [Monosiga brevicollis MX1]